MSPSHLSSTPFTTEECASLIPSQQFPGHSYKKLPSNQFNLLFAVFEIVIDDPLLGHFTVKSLHKPGINSWQTYNFSFIFWLTRTRYSVRHRRSQACLYLLLQCFWTLPAIKITTKIEKAWSYSAPLLVIKGSSCRRLSPLAKKKKKSWSFRCFDKLWQHNVPYDECRVVLNICCPPKLDAQLFLL